MCVVVFRGLFGLSDSICHFKNRSESLLVTLVLRIGDKLFEFKVSGILILVKYFLCSENGWRLVRHACHPFISYLIFCHSKNLH